MRIDKKTMRALVVVLSLVWKGQVSDVVAVLLFPELSDLGGGVPQMTNRAGASRPGETRALDRACEIPIGCGMGEC